MKQIQIVGFEKCPDWLRKKYRIAVDFRCQMCNQLEKDVGCLQVHRLKRGNLGGLYTMYPINHKLNNCRVICKNCHNKLHSNELGVTQ